MYESHSNRRNEYYQPYIPVPFFYKGQVDAALLALAGVTQKNFIRMLSRSASTHGSLRNRYYCLAMFPVKTKNGAKMALFNSSNFRIAKKASYRTEAKK